MKNLKKEYEEFEKTFAKTWDIAIARNLSIDDVEKEILNYRRDIKASRLLGQKKY
ncbi:hypothetical protein HYV89_02780 [Candidatus Woesearchaeota archaeon]|nr:hypothetical protein [Candidatus Woesearchaeota archaeon]